MMDPQYALADLQAAYLDFERGQYEAVVERIEQTPDHGGELGSSLSLAAQGLLLERAGRVDEAMPLMERAFVAAAGMHALLRELGAFFRRAGKDSLANHAFLLEQLVWPAATTDAVGLIRVLPPRERALYALWAMRASPWLAVQDLLGLAPFKAALAERLGSDAAAFVLARMKHEHGARKAGRRPLVPLLEHARDHGRDFEELIAPGPSTSRSIRPVPPGEEPPERRTQAMIACTLEDVIVHARSSVLLTGDRALFDVQDRDVLRRAPVDLAVDPLIVSGGPDELVLVEPLAADLERMDEAVWLTGAFTPAFGHWIMEYLPKVWALMRRPRFSEIPILVDEGMPHQHYEALRYFLGERNPMRVLHRGESVRVGRLWVATALVYIPIGPLPQPPRPRQVTYALDDQGFRKLLSVTDAALAANDPASGPRRIYLSRKPSQRRRLTNAGQIEPILEDHGFEAYDFGQLSFSEQIRIVRGADHVIATAGSAALMTIFGRPGLRVAVMTTQWSEVGWLAQATQALDHELTILVGEITRLQPDYTWQSDYQIDPALLSDYLAGLDHEAAGTTPSPTLERDERLAR